MDNQKKVEEGICIVSFDGGGPGSMSQLRMLDEFMRRLAFELDLEVDELRPADYFDLMGGVGFGGFVALLLGRLRMTTTQAMEELSAIGSETFLKGDEMTTTEVAMTRLRTAIESMLERHGHPVGMKLRNSSDNQCKVVLFAATTEVMDHCHPFRTYRSPRKALECTLVDAACAIMAIPEYFSSVSIGPRFREQIFAGIPDGFNNPMREVIKEAQLVFGEKTPVSLVLSLGSGQRARISDHDHNITRLSRIHGDGVARDLQHQFRGFGEYLRLNVDRGMERIKPDDWHKLGSIETYTNVYLEMNQITKYIDEAFRWLLQRNGSVTLGQLCGTSDDCVIKFHSETLEKYLEMGMKQMDNIVQKLGIERITLVDAIGNHIPIPIEFCLTYSMLSELIGFYFRHQKVPGRDFVQRGDYRLVQGSRKNTVGPMEWARIDKVGLKVEMSMILRTHNEDRARCPSCRTWFEGHSINGWVQCMSCSGQFQIETQFQAKADLQSDDTIQPEDRRMIEHNVATLVVMDPNMIPLTSGQYGALSYNYDGPRCMQFCPILLPNSNRPIKLDWLTSANAKTAIGKDPDPVDSGIEYSIFVGDIAGDVTNDDLMNVFRNPNAGLQGDFPPRFIAPFLSCCNAKVMVDSVTGISTGYGFVRFTSEADQKRALLEMQGLYCKSRPMRLSPATAKNKNPGADEEHTEPIPEIVRVTHSYGGPTSSRPTHISRRSPIIRPSTTQVRESTSEWSAGKWIRDGLRGILSGATTPTIRPTTSMLPTPQPIAVSHTIEQETPKYSVEGVSDPRKPVRSTNGFHSQM